MYMKWNNEINREYRISKGVFLNNIYRNINEALQLRLIDKAYGMVSKFFGEKKLKI